MMIYNISYYEYQRLYYCEIYIISIHHWLKRFSIYCNKVYGIVDMIVPYQKES